MSSLELVEFINSQRKEGEVELRHDNFMAKVPKVLGEEAAPKFLGAAFYTNGTGAKVERKVYNFPKREACLMAMSYSYELQAKVFDRMTELEAKQPVAQFQGNVIEAVKLVPAMVEAAKAFGFVGNQAALSANKALVALSGVDVLAAMGHTHLIADKKALTFTPTELGQQVEPPISAQMINRLLTEAGLQIKVNDRWEPTDEGLPHAEVLDTGKSRSSGVPVKQVKWFSSVLELI